MPAVFARSPIDVATSALNGSDPDGATSPIRTPSALPEVTVRYGTGVPDPAGTVELAMVVPGIGVDRGVDDGALVLLAVEPVDPVEPVVPLPVVAGPLPPVQPATRTVSKATTITTRDRTGNLADIRPRSAVEHTGIIPSVLRTAGRGTKRIEVAYAVAPDPAPDRRGGAGRSRRCRL
jgi:hypothetical protein